MKYISTKDKLPEAPHLAALVFSSIHIDGDERSRTNPGHGYPAHDKAVVEYIAFDSREEAQKWVEQQEKSRYSAQSYRIIEAFPRAVTTTVSVGLG